MGITDSIVARLAAEILDDLTDFSGALTARIRDAEPAYRALPEEQLLSHVTIGVQDVLQDVVDGRVTHLDSARQIGRQRAEQGVPLAIVLHAYRLAFGAVWDAMLDRATTSGGADVPALLEAVNIVWGTLDTHSQVVADAYQSTLVAISARDTERRLMLIDALFEGRLGDWRLLQGTPEALNLPRSGRLVAVSAESPVRGEESLPLVHAALQRKGIRSVWRQHAEVQLGVVAVPTETSMRTLLHELQLLAVGVRVGLSDSFPDLLQTCGNLQTALVAMRSMPSGTAGITSISDEPLGSLLAAAPEMAERLGIAFLGPILGLPEAEREVLLDTLAAYFLCEGSPARAAERLYCHRNTVTNRLRRVEQLSGRSLSAPRGVAELYMATQAAWRIAGR